MILSLRVKNDVYKNSFRLQAYLGSHSSGILNKDLFILILFECFTCLSMYVPHKYISFRGQKIKLDTLELESQTVAKLPISAGKQI